MTDETRELLERAAKAVGIEHTGVTEGGAGLLDETGAWDRFWNPLKSLSDALRLAVDLGLSIVVQKNLKGEDTGVAAGMGGEDFRLYSVHYSDHPSKYRATCMAIVKAAAEIGRRMQ